MCQLLRGLGLGTTLLWPQSLANGQRGRQQVEAEGWGTVPHCSKALSGEEQSPRLGQQDSVRKQGG